MAVLNVELVLIYIKKEPLEDPRHKEITEGIFGFKTGPHYSIAIEAIEAFRINYKWLSVNLPWTTESKSNMNTAPVGVNYFLGFFHWLVL